MGSILGDINPEQPRRSGEDGVREDLDRNPEADESMVGGSQHDRSRHSGSRDVTESTTGGTGTETGGTRNYRSGTGATGMDIGNRPE
ncbi:MAG: hypothetical protein U0P82_04495 [Vicinamibacterales bacterium]